MKKHLALILVLAMLAALMAGCSSQAETSTEPAASESAETVESTAVEESSAPAEEPDAPAEDAAEEPAEEVSEEPVSLHDQYSPEYPEYPISDGEQLTMLVEFPGFLASNMETMQEMPSYIRAAEITGVDLQFHSVSQTALTEQFNLMCASGSLPDLVGGSVSYTSGSAAAIEDEVFVDLTDLVHNFMGDYWDILASQQSYLDSAIDENGYMAYFMGFTDASWSDMGPQLRKDWLDEFGMDLPQTYDEYHEYLTAAKTTYGTTDTIMFTGSTQQQGSGWIGGYGTTGVASDSSSNMMLDPDGNVTSGYVIETWKDYLQMMNQWYSEGLLNPDFISMVDDPMASNADSLVLGGQTALWYARADIMGTYISKATDPNFDAIGGYEPQLTAGEKFHFGGNGEGSASNGVAMSTNCENQELAAKWMNFWYTEEGQMLSSWGIEGVSFEYGEDGKPAYNDAVLNNPDFFMTNFAIAYYTASQTPSMKDSTKDWANYRQESIDAILLWTESSDDAYVLPTNLSLTVDESERFTVIMTDINTYAEENVMKFVTGELGFDNWDNFVGTIESMGIDEAIEIYQAAYDRYMASKA